MAQLKGATVYSTNNGRFMVYQMITNTVSSRYTRDTTRGYWETSLDGGITWKKGEPHRITESEYKFCEAIIKQAKE